MTTSHGRRIQSRRALAVLAWLSLVIVAGLLWYAQVHRIIRIQAWEPAALLLSAYAAFLSIFGWLLFSPERKSAEESPALFFAGMLTLLPPCFIAYHLMPPDSPLKGWLTIGIFLFGVIAILSPLPADVFAIPRDRRSYLRPVTDSYLSVVDVDAPTVSFEHVLPQTAFRLTQPEITELAAPSPARDPWSDPFSGTGRRMSRIGVSRSRRTEESDSKSPRQGMAERPQAVPTPHIREDTAPAVEQFQPPVTQAGTVTATGLSSQQSRKPAASVPMFRRPLTEPGQMSSNPVGFQTPSPSQFRPLALPQVPPPLPPSASTPLSVSDAIIPTTMSSSESHSRNSESSLRELDRQLRSQYEMEDADAEVAADDISITGAALTPVAGVSRSGQQAAGDATLERIRDEHGGEMIEGTIPVFFEIGQKRAHLHVPFSPPLPGLPEVECEPVGEDSIRLKVAVRQPYGIRIEARRSDAAESLKTEISFAAVYTPGPRRS